MIVLEFNELSPALMETFIDQGYLPNFKRLRDESSVFTTDAEEVAPNLDPWIQWVTVHSGLSYDEHGIFHLGDGDKLAVRYIGHSAERARAFLHGAWRLLRPAVLGRAAVPPRVWAT